MKVWSALRSSKLDQELCGLCVAALNRNSFVDCPYNGEKLAADLPSIVTPAPGIGMLRAGQKRLRNH